eukprot:431950_1
MAEILTFNSTYATTTVNTQRINEDNQWILILAVALVIGFIVVSITIAIFAVYADNIKKRGKVTTSHSGIKKNCLDTSKKGSASNMTYATVSNSEIEIKQPSVISEWYIQTLFRDINQYCNNNEYTIEQIQIEQNEMFSPRSTNNNEHTVEIPKYRDGSKESTANGFILIDGLCIQQKSETCTPPIIYV